MNTVVVVVVVGAAVLACPAAPPRRVPDLPAQGHLNCREQGFAPDAAPKEIITRPGTLPRARGRS